MEASWGVLEPSEGVLEASKGILGPFGGVLRRLRGVWSRFEASIRPPGDCHGLGSQYRRGFGEGPWSPLRGYPAQILGCLKDSI